MAARIQLIRTVAQALTAGSMTLVTAESCTGGLIAAELTSVPGSSEWFEGAFVTYRPSAKVRMIGVPAETISRFGVVSEPTARAMAEGAIRTSDAGISVAVTGVAGPGGGGLLTPVGTVWFAWARAHPRIECLQTARHEFSGDRADVREQAVALALEGVRAILSVR
jgi:nicotinamide-nucleotide amidase